MLRAYPKRSSILPGEVLTLHVSTNSHQFKVEIYRQGETLDLVDTSGWMPGFHFEEGPEDEEWGWLGYNLSTGTDWKSGVYIAVLIEGDSAGNEIDRPATDTADGRTSKAMFVLKSAAPGKDACILYKVPLFTYYAYNAKNQSDQSGSLYTGARKVSFLRPGGGTGGTPWDAGIRDEYDLTTPRQTFAHWDALFISWLEKNKIEVEYCTDLDVHQNNGNFIASYRLILSVGHDEYWSAQMRQNTEQFISKGGNVAFFSGNTCWWMVHLEDSDTAMSCDKPADQWFNTRPENSLTGVSYRNGSGWWSGAREAVGYQVQQAGHWVFAGTGLSDGDIFGATESTVGYECDGCLFTDIGGIKIPSSTDGTPANFAILGIGNLSGNWQDQLGGNLAATMGVYVNHGIVFTAATTDWARVLSSEKDLAVEQITRNVLKHLAAKALKIYGLPHSVCGTQAVAGQKITFHVDTSSLMNTANLHYKWSISAGNGTSIDKPLFEPTLPSPPTVVTVSVVVDDGTDCPAFGTISFTPLTKQQAALFELLCRFRTLAQHLSIAVTGIGEGKGPFVDPLFDPPKGELLGTLNAKEANAILLESKRFVTQLQGFINQIGKSHG